MKGAAGKVVIITGASRGIGRGIARHFAEEGASVSICARTASDVERAAAELEQHGVEVFHRVCDVSNGDQAREFVAATCAKLGRLDILINNAAYMSAPQPFETISDETFQACIAGGLSSVFYMMKAAFPFMKAGGGHIVNFASFAGFRGGKNLAGYAAAKMGVVGLTRAAAAEWAQFRISVNCVAPIAMSSSWSSALAGLPSDVDPFEAIHLRRNLAARPGDPFKDIAPAVAFLCSDASRFVTGHVLPVDGGLLELG